MRSVGDENVSRAVLTDTHQLDGFRMEPFSVASKESQQITSAPPPPAMRRLRPAETVSVMLQSERPRRSPFGKSAIPWSEVWSVIGNAVFGRVPDYDIRDDPVVRLCASEGPQEAGSVLSVTGPAARCSRADPLRVLQATFLWGKVDLAAHADENLAMADSHESAAVDEEPQPLAITMPHDETVIADPQNSVLSARPFRPRAWLGLATMVLLGMGCF
ncbi:hypothetical protein JAO29_14915 [Edaphobacter sp. HDX4]|uniref:hypothetical protein n=1 Tax=Edaphobacter sp. HDX4 TaxID=2794064 RepID=UPI002FE60AC5